MLTGVVIGRRCSKSLFCSGKRERERERKREIERHKQNKWV